MTIGTSQMHVDRARRLVEVIKSSVSVARESIVEAFHGRAWIPLGYDSWDALCDNEFGVRLRLPVEQRSEAVGELKREGMSNRAIGSALGYDEKTVRNALSGAENSAPEGAPHVDFLTGEVLDDYDAEPEPMPERTRGLDGKSYPAYRRPEPSPLTPSPETLAFQARTRLVGRLDCIWHNFTSNLIDAMREASATPGIAEHLSGDDHLGGEWQDRYVARLREIGNTANALADQLQPSAQPLRSIK